MDASLLWSASVLVLLDPDLDSTADEQCWVSLAWMRCQQIYPSPLSLATVVG